MKKIVVFFLLLAISVPCFAEDRIDSYPIRVTEEGRHGPITFLITVDREGKVEDIEILEIAEVKGAKIGRRRFLKQFIGKGSQNPIRLGRDIDGVTGATVSSKAATRAVKRALLIWEERER